MKLVSYVLWRYYPVFARDEDLCQEASIGLWHACCRYDEEKGKFSTFAVSCIKNAVRAALQKRRRKRRWAPDGVVSMDTPMYGDGEASMVDTVEDPVSSAFESGVLTADLVERLGERDRQIVAMKYVGLSHMEIGARLGKSPCYVSYRLKRIREACGQVS